MRKSHKEKLDILLSDYDEISTQINERNKERNNGISTRTVPPVEEPVYGLDCNYLSLDGIRNQTIIGIRCAESKLNIDRGDIILKIPGEKHRMMIVEYVDGTQAFFFEDRRIIRALDKYGVFGAYYPRYYSYYPVLNLYYALSIVVPAFRTDYSYKYSMYFSHKGGIELDNFGDIHSVYQMIRDSTKVYRYLLKSCDIWSSLWLLDRYGKEADKVINAVVRTRLALISGRRNPDLFEAYKRFYNYCETAINTDLWIRDCIKIKMHKCKESSESVHIVIGYNGIFIIKEIHGDGNLIISNADKWTWETGDKCITFDNPEGWFRERMEMIRSIIMEDAPIRLICCIDNDDGGIEGNVIGDIHVVKLENMARFLEEFPCDTCLTKEHMKKLADYIYEQQYLPKRAEFKRKRG